MIISIDTSSLGSSIKKIQGEINSKKENLNRQVLSRGTRALNQLRNAELEVLSGQRSGKVYRIPFSKATYVASAPGEPPAQRTRNLHLHWNGSVKGGSGKDFTLRFESGEKYSVYLDEGTTKMAPRPFKDRITEKALPSIQSIFNEPYT